MTLSPEATALAVILVGVVVLWITEALPLPVTALLGAVACVVAGVAPAEKVFQPFADPVVFLFIGSFMLAEAIRVHGLDRRLAYAVLGLPWVGEAPRRVLGAVAFVSALISAFISNTATTAMMVAIVAGMLAAIEEAAARQPDPGGRRLEPAFATGLMLCVAFAASIGGLATPIGTPPNIIGLAFIRDTLGVELSFPGWCAIGVPLVVVDPVSGRTLAEHLYPLGDPDSDACRWCIAAADGKVSAIAAAGPRALLVLEQSDTESRLYRVEIPERSAPGRTPLGKTLVADLAPLAAAFQADVVPGSTAAPARLSELKFEGMTLLGPDRVALVNDNDFDIAADGGGPAVPAARRSCLWILRLPAPLP